MSKDKVLSNLFVYAIRISLYLGLYVIFLFFFSNLNMGLLSFTRLSVFVTFNFFMALIIFSLVYGNFEIGVRKSKPIIYSALVTVLFSNIIAYFSLIISGTNKADIGTALLMGAVYLVFTTITQLLLIVILAYLGNHFYFVLNNPLKTMIIYNDDLAYNKIENYVKSHERQYELIKVVKNNNNSNVNISGTDIIFLLGMSSDFNNEMVENCYYESKSVYFDANMHDVLLGKNRTIVYDDVLMVEYSTQKLTLFQRFVKRTIDILFSIVFLIITLPIILIIAIAIKIDDRGPVFYRQERLTEDARVFEIIKFRSMKIDSGNKPASVNDSRITRVGNVIRKLRIDELPQFVNILKGDMSVVGPRPESVGIMEDIMDEHPKFVYRLKVKAGLTGYAQIFGKYNTTPEQKLLMDIKYIETFSVLNDVKLMLQTVNVFFKGDSTEGFD